MTTNTLQELINVRRSKLEAARARGNAYPNGYTPTFNIRDFISTFEHSSKELLETTFYESHSLETQLGMASQYALAGRIKLHRVMGKTSFAQIADHSGMVQLYLRKRNSSDELGVDPEQYSLFKKFDLGDIIFVKGLPYRTNKGELSLRITGVHLLSKCLRPLPDKHHGLADQEMRYRQRYLDLMVNPDSISIFTKRSQLVSHIRHQMEDSGFLEVETPMMHSIPGGATARPFITHHNALDVDLYLRVAPELHLKRLIVGGFTQVFEINRNFRNEGLSPRHNPEFTMMEFYAAYWDYQQLIVLISNLLRSTVLRLHDSFVIEWQGQKLDFGEIKQMTMLEAVQATTDKNISFASLDMARASVRTLGLESVVEPEMTAGMLLAKAFEELVEHTLIQPTFITGFPVDVSPLARRNDADPNTADRFELFIAGQEIANGFSELNDPDDQASRFKAQVAAREAGDKEAMYYDADYITALEYAMPPTAGAGIGIDRLAMILLNQSNIRDVVLFPQMRPQEGVVE